MSTRPALSMTAVYTAQVLRPFHLHKYKYKYNYKYNYTFMEVLAVSDGVADLLGLGVVEVMGSQLTDMVNHHW